MRKTIYTALLLFVAALATPTFAQCHDSQPCKLKQCPKERTEYPTSKCNPKDNCCEGQCKCKDAKATQKCTKDGDKKCSQKCRKACKNATATQSPKPVQK